eukprot:9481130-Pyramimonas_sp.AAC.2
MEEQFRFHARVCLCSSVPPAMREGYLRGMGDSSTMRVVNSCGEYGGTSMGDNILRGVQQTAIQTAGVYNLPQTFLKRHLSRLQQLSDGETSVHRGYSIYNTTYADGELGVPPSVVASESQPDRILLREPSPAPVCRQ